jgi:hypothetical protein
VQQAQVTEVGLGERRAGEPRGFDPSRRRSFFFDPPLLADNRQAIENSD